MKQFISNYKKGIAAIVICLLTGAITMSFEYFQYDPLQTDDCLSQASDTIPAKKKSQENMTIQQYDDLMNNLDKEMQNVKAALSNMNTEKINSEIQASLGKIDFAKLDWKLTGRMKEVDFAAIEKNVQNAIEGIEWNKLNEDAKISLEKAKQEIEHIDMAELKKELNNAKKEIAKSKVELSKIDLNKIMQNANEGIKSAGESLRKQKAMFNEMEKDGLISQKEGFTIEFKNKSLYINGKKQNERVTEKYSHYMNGDNYSISIDKE